MEKYHVERVSVDNVTPESISVNYVAQGKAVIITNVLGEKISENPWTKCKPMTDLRFFATNNETSQLPAEISVQQYGVIQQSEEFEMELNAEAAMDLFQLRSTEDPAIARSGTDKPGEVIYVKLALTGCESLMEHLNLQAFANPKAEEEPYIPSTHPLLLGPSSYFCWAYIGEAGSGSKTHVDVASSDAFLTVLSGKKEWAMVHPLDKHLVMDEKGKFADLFNIDHVRFPQAKRARLCTFYQGAGDCVYVPSEAPHCVRNIDTSISITYNFSAASTKFRFHTAMDKVMSPQPSIATVDLLIFCPTVKKRATLRGYVQELPAPLPSNDFECRMALRQLHTAFGIYGRFLDDSKTNAIPIGFDICRSSHRMVYYFEMSSEKNFTACFERPPFATESYEYDETCHPANLFTKTASHFGLVPSFPPLRVIINQPLFPNMLFETSTIGDILDQGKTTTIGNSSTATAETATERQWHYSRFPFQYTSIHQNQKEAAWCRTYLFYSSHELQGPISLHPLLEDSTLQRHHTLYSTTLTEDLNTDTSSKMTLYEPHFVALEWKKGTSYRTGPLIYNLKDDLVGNLTKRLVLAEDGLLQNLFKAATAHGFILGSENAETNSEAEGKKIDTQIEALLSIGLEKVMILVLYFCCLPKLVGFTYSHTFSAVEEPNTVCLSASAADTLLKPLKDDAAALALTQYCNTIDPPMVNNVPLNPSVATANTDALANALIANFPSQSDIISAITVIKTTSRSKIELV